MEQHSLNSSRGGEWQLLHPKINILLALALHLITLQKKLRNQEIQDGKTQENYWLKYARQVFRGSYMGYSRWFYFPVKWQFNKLFFVADP